MRTRTDKRKEVLEQEMIKEAIEPEKMKEKVVARW